MNNNIRSVEDAIRAVQYCGFEKGEIIFRGQVDAGWDILPSLYRIYPDFQRARLYEAASVGPLFLEKKLPHAQNFDPLEQLIIAQHYGLPTRLVDWTNDILVGLFFACYDRDGMNADKNGRLTLTQRSMYEVFKFNSAERKEYINIPNPHRVSDYAAEITLNDLHILEPMVKNPRMRVQDGCFMLFPWKFESSDIELLTLNKYIREQRKFVDSCIRAGAGELAYLFVAHKDVDKEFKSQILQDLSQTYGISEDTIFIDTKLPESTAAIIEELKLHAEIKSLQLSEK